MTSSLWGAHASGQNVPVARGVLFMSFVPGPDPEKPNANGTNPPPSGVNHDPNHSAGLSAATVTHADLARWLLERETDLESDPPGLSAAAERVCQKLARRLSRSIAPAGSQAILSRALHLARAEFPFLEGVRAGRAPETCFEGLDERVHDVEAGEAGKALLAVLRTMLDLLVKFIGEDLTAHLVREVWPDLPSREPSRPGNSDAREAAP